MSLSTWDRTDARMMHDKKIIGVCGETSIANAKQSIVTMSQVRWLVPVSLQLRRPD